MGPKAVKQAKPSPPPVIRSKEKQKKMENENENEKKAAKPRKLTFAEKMRAKRSVNGGTASASSTSSFGDRFSRSSSFGSGLEPSAFGGGRFRGRMNDRNNGKEEEQQNGIRPKHSK